MLRDIKEKQHAHHCTLKTLPQQPIQQCTMRARNNGDAEQRLQAHGVEGVVKKAATHATIHQPLLHVSPTGEAFMRMFDDYDSDQEVCRE